ncbi:hypothetical protein F5884DRAFT_743815 [Xylogone sp. PMI_703]|nr:hypothetical protein F5884DRAFT_743815 [Xylogone sp. PMI_703]
MQYSTLALALLAGGASATTFRVDVGSGGTLTFSPDTVVAAVGDIIEYHFFPKNHSVVQGSFNTPCQTGSVTNGFFSGFHPTASGEEKQIFQVTVQDTKPIWVYCSQTTPFRHCPLGMVSVVNPPTSGPNTLAAYRAAAAAFNGTITSPSQVQGGALLPNNATSPSGTATPPSGTSSPPSGTGAPGSGPSSNATVSSVPPPPTPTESGSGAPASIQSMGIKGLVAVALGGAALFL